MENENSFSLIIYLGIPIFDIFLNSRENTFLSTLRIVSDFLLFYLLFTSPKEKYKGNTLNDNASRLGAGIIYLGIGLIYAIFQIIFFLSFLFGSASASVIFGYFLTLIPPTFLILNSTGEKENKSYRIENDEKTLDTKPHTSILGLYRIS